MSNQSAASSISSLERASKKSRKKQIVNKISKNVFGEFENFGGSDVANKLLLSRQKIQIYSFVFWENLQRTNLLTVLSDL